MHPASTPSLVAELRTLGLHTGDIVLVHASLSSLGYVIGGAHAVIDALVESVGPTGTVVMPAHSGDVSEPSHWRAPPPPPKWLTAIREHLPAFDVDKTPSYRMGVIAESFRRWPGALRSNHPTGSFSALGTHARALLHEHPLEDAFGELSPLARLYDYDAKVLLLGVGHDRNTSLHLAERRALVGTQPRHLTGSPIRVDGKREWRAFEEPAVNSNDFAQLGAALELETRQVTVGRVAAAVARLLSQRVAVDFGAHWLREHRHASS